MRSGRRDRPGRVFAEPDPVRRLRGAAHWLRVLYSAGFDVVLIFEAATDESPETRALLRSKLAGRNEVMDAMIASLDGHLAVPVPQAQAMYRALAAPGVYRELVEESGWSPEDFERWVGNTLQRNLMPQATPPPGTERPGTGLADRGAAPSRHSSQASDPAAGPARDQCTPSDWTWPAAGTQASAVLHGFRCLTLQRQGRAELIDLRTLARAAVTAFSRTDSAFGATDRGFSIVV